MHTLDIQNISLSILSVGGAVKDQATVDEDASLKERMAIGIGSVATGVKEGTDDALFYNIAKSVEQGAGDVADHYADKRDTSLNSESD